MTRNRFRRIAAWVLLGAIALPALQPLAFAAEAGGSSAYGDWIKARGAEHSDSRLEQALKESVARRHGSLESFVYDFVDVLEAQGSLELAGAILAGDAGGLTARELAALLLVDLRSLSPNDPVSTARLNQVDGTATGSAGRVGVHRTAVRMVRIPLLVPAAGPPGGTQPGWGITTSIQALGP